MLIAIAQGADEARDKGRPQNTERKIGP